MRGTSDEQLGSVDATAEGQQQSGQALHTELNNALDLEHGSVDTNTDPSVRSPFDVDVSSVDAIAEPPQRTRIHRRHCSITSVVCAKLRRVIRCLWYPIVFLAGIMTVVTMLIFCVLPGIFVIAIFFCCYYACVRDPAPLSVWMIQLFGDDPTPNTPRKTRQEMEAMLITRRVVSIENCKIEENDEHLPDPTTHRKHAGKVMLSSNQCNRRIVFSEILSSPALDVDHDGMKNDGEDCVEFSSNNTDESVEGEQGSKLPGKGEEHEQHEHSPRTATDDDTLGDLERPSSPVSLQHSHPHPDSPCCDICLGEYEEDDLVCWSANPACMHVFHQECILDWLERKPNCPNCRRGYLVEPNTEDSKDSNV
jgi:hypothetical protein